MGLGTEGYSPAALRLAVRQAGKAPSFKDASDDLRELARLPISPSHLQRLVERIGTEWAAVRDAEVAAFRKDELPTDYAQAAAQAATVMVDGGRYQGRAEDAGVGVTDPGWREVKVACCQTLTTKAHAVDPQPEPPKKFLDPIQAARLAAEMKARARPASTRVSKAAKAGNRDSRRGKRRRRPKAKRSGPRKLVRTVLASTARSEDFGWQVAAEVQRRGLDRARTKGYICDGQRYNWSLYELHLVALGFIGILDFLHLLAYL